MTDLTKTAIIILAGGQSRRLGTSKQLLDMNGMPLLQRIIREAASAAIGPVGVVTGAYTQELLPIIEDEKALPVQNNHWQEGMASSIRCGLEFMCARFPSLEAVFLLVSDQPYIRSELLQQMLRLQEEKNYSIVACSYSHTFGTPILIQRTHFDALHSLKGDTGARKICRQYEQELGLVRFDEGAIDIDTREDYEAFKNRRIC
jgi:molybdenum cofactor cytidylyltransferase